MNRIDPKRALVFIGIFSTIAILIASAKTRDLRQQQAAIEKVEQEQKAEAAAVVAKAKFQSRYLNSPPAKTPGMQSLAVFVLSENGRPNNSLSSALAQHLKSARVQTLTSLLTPEFASDGLFDRALDGSSEVINKLELTKFLDAVLLAKQSVRYSRDPSLENVTSATMQLDVTLLSVTARGQSQSWTFSASGSGFKETEARAMAEERLIKQIAKDTKMSLNQ